MPRRKPKIISREVAGGAARAIPMASSLHPYLPPQKTAVEELYDLVFTQSVKGYRFTDDEYGEPWIEEKDIEGKGDGVSVIRFRCPVGRLHKVFFGEMAKDVCKAMNCGLHLMHKQKTEYGIPFEECVWVLQKGELSQEKEGADSSCKSTPEEIDERIEEALKNFV